MSKILIVDDSRTNLALLSHLTGRVHEGVRITTKDHAQKALDWLQTHTPDVIIVDYSMPDMNGVEFTRRCRTLRHIESVPIVMVTSARRRKVCLAALRAGATEFLNSPINESDFVTRIGQLLQWRFKNNTSTTTVTDGNSGTRALPFQAYEQACEWSRFAAVLDNIPVMLNAVSATGECLFVNAAQADFFEQTPSDLIGKNIDDLPTSIRQHLDCSQDLRRNARKLTSDLAREFEHEHIDEHGIKSVLLTTKRPIMDRSHNIIAVLSTSIDITSRKQAEENLLYVAEHDSLTELPNRLGLRHHIDKCIEHAKSNQTKFSLLFIDIDRFKDINDTLGHEFGDRLLYTIASRLDDFISFPNFVARLGGDEFAVVLSDNDNLDNRAEQARQICERLNQPIFLGQNEVRVSASIGIAGFPNEGCTVDELLSRADLAMYRAKANGGNGVRMARSRDYERACLNVSLEADLRRAISRNQLQLYYQPKVRLSDNQIIGAEALIRWQHPDRGLVSPANFLPLAEQTDLILPIGEWVVHTACQDASDWIARGHQNVNVCVNISPCQFAKQNIGDLVESAVQQASLAPSDLVIELTEQSIIRNTQTLKADLERLREAHVKLSLDDFGTGYASLRHLQQFPITELKIDRSFIKNHTSDKSDRAIVNTIIELGRSLNLDVVAEGVETLADVTSLSTSRCPTAQGYYFSPPVPLKEFHDILKSDQWPVISLGERCA